MENFIQTLAQRQISTDCRPIYRSSIDRLSTDILTAISVASTCSKHDPIFLGSKKALVTSHLPLMIIMIWLVWKLAVIFMKRPQLLKKKRYKNKERKRRKMEKREPRAKWTSILSNDIYIYDIVLYESSNDPRTAIRTFPINTPMLKSNFNCLISHAERFLRTLEFKSNEAD